MTTAVTDERQLPAMYMVWPIDRLPAAPHAAIPKGYALRSCLESELNAVRALVNAEWPLPEGAWEAFRDRIVPGGAFLAAHRGSGQPVATASAVHNPRASRYYFPFGGEVGYAVVDPPHRGRGLGRAVVARGVARLLAAGYRHIFVGVQGWRLPAVKCYLGLGFVPLLHQEELLPRWRRVCEQVGWPVQGGEWPRSLSAVAGSRA
jgi:mycothiol synthase